MSRAINIDNQRNLWGVASTDGLEPQRTDLFFVDFNAAVKAVSTAAGLSQGLAPVKPQYVRSITFPDKRTKSEPIRRDSVAANMPSWDEPLDAFKVTFVLDTHDQNDMSAVISFLDTWLALTRAGRGSRSAGFNPAKGYVRLNKFYRVDFQHNFNVWLLRGGNAVYAAQVADTVNRLVDAASTGLNLLGTLMSPTVGGMSALAQSAIKGGGGAQSDINNDLVAHTVYRIQNAWLAAYKLADFSHNESVLATVEATFYADDYETQTGSALTGQESVSLDPYAGYRAPGA